jgi:hypothetical protein
MLKYFMSATPTRQTLLLLIVLGLVAGLVPAYTDLSSVQRIINCYSFECLPLVLSETSPTLIMLISILLFVFSFALCVSQVATSSFVASIAALMGLFYFVLKLFLIFLVTSGMFILLPTYLLGYLLPFCVDVYVFSRFRKVRL